MSWVIRAYDTSSDLVKEIEVDGVLRQYFRSSLGVPDDDPMYDSYPMSRTLVAAFLALFDQPYVDNGDHDHFLDYDATSGS